MIINLYFLQSLALLLTVNLVYSRSNPMNTGCTKLVQTGTVVIISALIPSCNSGTYTTSNTITFVHQKSNNIYQIMFNIERKQSAQTSMRYAHYLFSNKTSSSISVTWQIQFTCVASYFRLRYLTKQSQFVAFHMQTSLICLNGVTVNYPSSNINSCTASVSTTNKTISSTIPLLDSSSYNSKYNYSVIAMISSLRFSVDDVNTGLIATISTNLINLVSISLTVNFRCTTCKYYYQIMGLNFVIFSQNEIKDKYYNFKIVKGQSSSQNLFNQKFSNQNLLYGLSAFQINPAVKGLKLSMTTISKNILVQIPTALSVHSYNFKYLIFDKEFGNINCDYCTPLVSYTHGLCYDQCPLGYKIKFGEYQCILDCNISCSTCTNNSCLICQDGRPVGNGCTSIAGCTQLIPNYHNITNNCMACNDMLGYKLHRAYNTCICQFGYIINNNICHNIVGCVLPFLQNNQIVCMLCDQSNKFIIFEKTCICIDGFQLDKIKKKCKDICGDGRIFQDECDDGNLQNRDGCSSRCQIQNSFICLDGSQTSKSKCFPSSNQKQINLILIRTSKIQGRNAGLFTFKFTPMINVIQRGTISNLAFSSVGVQSILWSLVNDQLQITVDYNETLQMKNASLTFNMANVFINTLNFSIQFVIKSDTIQLLHIANQNQIDALKTCLTLFSWIIIVIFIIASAIHKMAGVQFIHTYQLIFLVFMLEKKMTVYYSIFKYFSYVNLNFMFYLNDSNSLNINSLATTYDKDNQIFVLQIILCPVLTLLVGFFIATTLKKCINFSSFQTIMRKLYENILFPFMMMTLLQILFIIYSITYSRAYVDSLMLTLAANVAYVIMVIIIFYQWRLLLIKPKQLQLRNYSGLSQCHFRYIPIYITFYFSAIFIIIMSNYLEFIYSKQALLALILICLMIFIKIMPYQQSIHNTSQILNILVFIIFLVVSILRAHISQMLQEHIQLMIIFCFSLLVVAHMIVNIIRIAYILRRKCVQTTENLQMEQNKQLMRFQRQAMQRYKTQLYTNIKDNKSNQPLMRKNQQAQIALKNKNHIFYRAYIKIANLGNFGTDQF